LPVINVPGIGDVFADGFAEEQTMQRILAVLQNQADPGPNQATGFAAQTRQTQNKINQLGTAANQTAENLTQTSANLTRNNRLRSQYLARFGRDLQTVITNPLRGFISTLNTTGDGLVDFLGKNGAFASVIGKIASFTLKGLGLAAGFLTERFFDTLKTFDSLQQAGGLFSGSMLQMRTAASSAGLTLSQYSKVVESSTRAMSMFGGTTQQGALEFSRANGRVISEQGRLLLNLGFQFEDIGNMTAEFIAMLEESGTRLGTFGFDTSTVSRLIRDQAVQFKTLAAFTGETVKQEQEKAKQMRRDNKVAAALGNLNAEQQVEIRGLISAFPQFRQLILETAAFGGPATRQAGQQVALAPTSTRLLIEQIRGVRSGNFTANVADNLQQMTAMRNAISQEFGGQSQLSQLAILGRGGAISDLALGMQVEQRDLVAKLNNRLIDKITSDVERITQGTDKFTQAIINAGLAVQDFKVNADKLITDAFGTTIANLIPQGIQKIIEAFSKVLDLTSAVVNTQGMDVYLPGAGNLRLIDFSGGATSTPPPPDNTNNTNLPNAMTGGTTGANTTATTTTPDNMSTILQDGLKALIKEQKESNTHLRKIGIAT